MDQKCSGDMDTRQEELEVALNTANLLNTATNSLELLIKNHASSDPIWRTYWKAAEKACNALPKSLTKPETLGQESISSRNLTSHPTSPGIQADYREKHSLLRKGSRLGQASLDGTAQMHDGTNQKDDAKAGSFPEKDITSGRIELEDQKQLATEGRQYGADAGGGQTSNEDNTSLSFTGLINTDDDNEHEPEDDEIEDGENEGGENEDEEVDDDDADVDEEDEDEESSYKETSSSESDYREDDGGDGIGKAQASRRLRNASSFRNNKRLATRRVDGRQVAKRLRSDRYHSVSEGCTSHLLC